MSSNEKNPVSIRTNTLKTDPETLSGVLTEEGYDVSAVDDMPGYFNISKGMGLFDTDSYQSGHFTAQDPVAGMATLLLAPERGEKVLTMQAVLARRASLVPRRPRGECEPDGRQRDPQPDE